MNKKYVASTVHHLRSRISNASTKNFPIQRYLASSSFFQKRASILVMSKYDSFDLNFGKLKYTTSNKRELDKGSEGKIQVPVNSPEEIYITSRSFIDGHEVAEDFGTVVASHVDSVPFIMDIYLAIKGLFGGELVQYSVLHDKCCNQAVDKIKEMARGKGGDAIVNLSIKPNMVMNRAILGLNVSVVAYGTVVKLGPKKNL